MALETLKGIDKIGGFRVAHHFPDGDFFVVTEIDQHVTFAVTEIDQHVTINHRDNSIKFDIQNGPIKENGVNGCQVDTLIDAARAMIEGLNKKFPCKEYSKTHLYLSAALNALDERTITYQSI